MADWKADIAKQKTESKPAAPKDDLAVATETNEEMAKRLPVGPDGTVDRGPAIAERRRAAERIVATLKPGDKVGDFTVHQDNLHPPWVGGKSTLKPGEAVVEAGNGKDSHIIDLAGEVQGGEKITRGEPTVATKTGEVEARPPAVREVRLKKGTPEGDTPVKLTEGSQPKPAHRVEELIHKKLGVLKLIKDCLG